MKKNKSSNLIPTDENNYSFMNNLQRINLRTLSNQNVGILLSRQEDVMQAIKYNLPIITCIPKESNTKTPPKYFLDFEKKVNDFIDEQKQFNKKVSYFIEKQIEFNEKIINRLDKIEARLDNVEARLDNVEARLDKIEARLDNIVLKNNLVE